MTFRGIYLAAAVFAIALLGGITAERVLWQARPLTGADNATTTVVKERRVVVEENEALRGTIEQVSGTVIAVRRAAEAAESATGFIVTGDGLAIAPLSVVSSEETVEIETNATTTTASVIKRGGELALLSIDNGGFPTRAFADEADVGERLVLVSRKKAARYGSVATGTSAVIADTGILVERTASRFITNMHAHSARLAGSPVFDMSGALVGIAEIGRNDRISLIPAAEIAEFTGL